VAALVGPKRAEVAPKNFDYFVTTFHSLLCLLDQGGRRAGRPELIGKRVG